MWEASYRPLVLFTSVNFSPSSDTSKHPSLWGYIPCAQAAISPLQSARSSTSSTWKGRGVGHAAAPEWVGRQNSCPLGWGGARAPLPCMLPTHAPAQWGRAAGCLAQPKPQGEPEACGPWSPGGPGEGSGIANTVIHCYWEDFWKCYL